MFSKFLFTFYVTYKKININEKVDFAWRRSFNFVIKEVVILTLLCDHFSKTGVTIVALFTNVNLEKLSN